jgi:hypothetical protein
MMRYFYLLVVLSALVLGSCTRDFIEPNLEGKNVALLSPPDNFYTQSNQVTFFWEEVEGASHYRLQIVDSVFSFIRRIILDTAITGFSWIQPLQPGYYSWRIKAQNASSSTGFSSPRSIRVDTTSNISSQIIFLQNPTNSAFLNFQNIHFRWTDIPVADDYRFQILDSGYSLVYEQILREDSLSYFLQEGNWVWRVRGQNSISNTPYTTRTFTIDITPPSSPILNFPGPNDTVSSPVQLSWTRDVSAIADSLYVYPDSLVSAPLVNLITGGTTYAFSGGTGQIYFWRIRSRDQAGNWSGFSPLRKFRIN